MEGFSQFIEIKLFARLNRCVSSPNYFKWQSGEETTYLATLPDLKGKECTQAKRYQYY